MLSQETHEKHNLTKQGKSKISRTNFAQLKTGNLHLFILFPNSIITIASGNITLITLVNQGK